MHTTIACARSRERCTRRRDSWIRAWLLRVLEFHAMLAASGALYCAMRAIGG